MKAFFSLFTIGFISISFGQLENISKLQISEIMKGEGFIGNLPHDIIWTPDNKIIYQLDEDNDRVDEYFYSKFSQEEFVKLRPVELNDFALDGYEQSKNGKHFYYTNGPSLFAWKRGEDQVKLLYYDLKGIQSVQLVNDTSKLYFINDGNLYEYGLNQPEVKQITNFISGSESKAGSSNAMERYLENQQQELFDVVRKDLDRANEKKKRKELRNYSIPLPIYTEKGYLHSVKITPDEKFVTFIISDYPKLENTQVEDHITQSGWTKSISARPKIGREDAAHKLGIYSIENRTVIYVSPSDSDLEGIYARPDYLKLYEKDNYKPKANIPKNIIFHGPYFAEDGKALLEIKSYDNKDRWITLLDLQTGAVKLVDHQHDEAWIGGPGISGWNEEPGNIGWLKDNKTVYFQSEETGFSHLYLYDIEKEKKTQLTKGGFEIHKASLSNDGTMFFITANKLHPGNREFYHFEIKSKKWNPILTRQGNYEVEISPDEKQLAFRYSNKNTPWELFLMENKPEGTPKQITHSTTEEFQKYKWKEPNVITFKASDDVDVYARLYEPKETDKNNAAVIFVHGAGYLQNAHNWWSGYYREYMFHNLLVDNGYTVLDIDYRASAGYGRDCRTAIYRHMGGKDLSDHLDGRNYLIEKLGVDSARVGIYGGSYGGFITLMALLTEPGKFQCGAAIRSVTDWAHYNHEYTSNILNTPETDSIAFRQSSPIYFADGLEDKLLMLHGMVDDNVQYQDVVRLSQRFIELGKTNWDLIGYPVEPHGFKESSSWRDEYGRIFKLFQETLR